MRRATIAQQILAIATTPDRAAAVVGDLLEDEASGGRRRFWLTVMRTTLAFVWLEVVRFISGRHPAFSGADILGEIMDVWRFVWSRKRFVVIPVVLFTTVASVVAYSRPVRYRSEVFITVVPQRVPETFVKSTVTSRLEERLQTMTAQVLSRTRLERIINEFNLYEKERKTQIMQDVVEQMRRDIRAEVLRGDAFRIAYVGESPRTVMRVTEQLATLFINESLGDRARQSEGTSQFLETQVAELAREVDKFASQIEQAKAHKRLLPRSMIIEYEELQTMYRAALANHRTARVAENLESRSIGEQFKVLDPARIPESPEGPSRLNVSLFGAGAGLLMGLFLLLASAMRKPPAPSAVIPPA